MESEIQVWVMSVPDSIEDDGCGFVAVEELGALGVTGGWPGLFA